MKNIIGKKYILFLNEIKSRILTARVQAFRSVNKDHIKLYWDIGKLIVLRQEKYKWGNAVVEKLANDLKKEFKSTVGFSIQNLWYMRQFYLEYKNDLILQQAVGELPWGHNIVIFSQLKNKEERLYYLKSSVKLGWSRNVLLNQIKAGAYQFQKGIPKQHNFLKTLPEHFSEQANESLKSVYNLDFLDITNPVLEREMERRLVEKIKSFMLELGKGFTFIGNYFMCEKERHSC